VPASIRRPIPPPPRRGLLARLWGLLPAVLLLGLGAWVALFVVMAPQLPDTRELYRESRQAKVSVLAADGRLIAVRGATGQRFVQLGEISPWLVKAVLATEDSRFYRHFGVDPIGLARALVDNLRARDVVAGGSTITQQLAKNLYLTPERSLTRKLQELTLAIWLETHLAKDEILTLYLNRVYLGAGAYGVEAAAQRYFAKPAKELGLAESAMIVGLLKAPSALAPTNDLDRARERAGVVLARMQEEGLITVETAAAARAKPAKLAPEVDELAGYFVDWVLDGLADQLGKPERDLVVHTTLDRKLQAAADAALTGTLERSGAKNAVGQGAVVLLDAQGAVRAMVGGRSHKDSPFNRAVSARRQPGSAFKPFVYLTALEAGWKPGNTVDDRPVKIGKWQPVNFDGKYRGKITLAQSFALSVNTTAVRLAETVGPKAVAAKARQLGIASELQAVPSLALGTSEVSLLELTAAYLPFANGGLRRPVYGVSSVEDEDGRELYRYLPTSVQVIEPTALAGMRELMTAAIETGTGKAARLDGRPAGGKTGTTQHARDAWFLGYGGDYIAGVWLGNDDNRPMKGVSGANLPARVWREVMLATPGRIATPPTPPRPRPESEGLDWLLDVIAGAVGRATN
jgi:penicillin-binding protein 1A